MKSKESIKDCYSILRIKMAMNLRNPRIEGELLLKCVAVPRPFCRSWICEIETFLFYGRKFNSLKLVPMSSNELLFLMRQ